MDFYAAGGQAALEKFAIEFNSPAMKDVLIGALDKAYSRALAPMKTVSKKPIRQDLVDTLLSRQFRAERIQPNNSPSSLNAYTNVMRGAPAKELPAIPGTPRAAIVESHLPIRRMLGEVAKSTEPQLLAEQARYRQYLRRGRG